MVLNPILHYGGACQMVLNPTLHYAGACQMVLNPTLHYGGACQMELNPTLHYGGDRKRLDSLASNSGASPVTATVLDMTRCAW